MPRNFPTALALAVAAAALAPRPALAHVFPNAERPSKGSTVASPPATLSIKFNEQIESLFAKLEVLDHDGTSEDDGSPQVGPGGRELTVKLKPLKPGKYTVRWAVVAEDGHRAKGSYTFTVRGEP